MRDSHDTALPITTATIRIIEIVPQKGSGFTVIAELPPGIHVSSDDAWGAVLPGSFRGKTRVGKLWHFYYEEMPPFRPGDTIDVELSIWRRTSACALAWSAKSRLDQ
jgi:hypothetical protein